MLFWLAWAAHNVDSATGNEDAQGSIARTLVLASCQQLTSAQNAGAVLGELIGVKNACQQQGGSCPDSLGPGLMETQIPHRGKLIVPVLFALATVIIAIFTWISFGGSVPFTAAGYRVSAVFPQASNLYPGDDVRIAGINVGQVVGVQRAGDRARVTMQLQTQFAPLHRDARAILRTKTLLGEAYIELAPGTAARRRSPTVPPWPRAGSSPPSSSATSCPPSIPRHGASCAGCSGVRGGVARTRPGSQPGARLVGAGDGQLRRPARRRSISSALSSAS